VELGREMTNAERRAAVMAKVEARLQEIWPDKPGERTFGSFDDLEAMAVRTGDSLSQEVMAAGIGDALAEAGGARDSVCPRCGHALQWAKIPKTIATIRGPVRIERDYGYCRSCQHRFFPR
jgi:hypothetical protein